jgi:beta-aspartyl-peptidase (threonine type)
LAKLVVAHGGVDMSADDISLNVLRHACARAWVVQNHIDGVVAAIGVLEDHPAFNAGYGSVLTADGNVEVDAAIVDAQSGQYGGVAALSGIRHPAAVAAEVMRADGPVLLSGHGAQVFAERLGHPIADLKTHEQIEMWRQTQAGVKTNRFTGRLVAPSTETVGSVVVDQGAGAAASSTGGVCGKHAGRIGDSAILGAGLWGDHRCLVLCSGDGEAMISMNLARQVGERMASGESARQAVRWAVRRADEERGAVAAVLAVDRRTLSVSAAHNGLSFPVVARTEARTWVIDAERIGRFATRK